MQEKKKQYILDDLRIILAMFVLTVLFAFSCLLLSHGARGIWLAVLAQFTLLGVLGGVFLRRCLRIVQKNEQVMQLYAAGYTIADICHLKCYFSRGTEMALKKAVALLDTGKLLSVSKRQAQYLALQNQINPHFLYNSLSIINWKAIEAGEDEISHVTLALSTYYRTSLNRGETMTTVAKEIDNIRAYLKIQLVMHDNEFRVVEQISDGLNDYMIPKLILQPLAENAIDHGIDVSDNEDPTLWLTIREEDKHIFFEIRDNGAGMTQEKADQILTYQSSGYGVRNVCDRIHVLYGEKGEMKIESTPGKGTRVFIRIPKKTEAKVL